MGDATTRSGGYKSPPLFKSGVRRGAQTAAQAGVHVRVFLCRFSLTGLGFEDREISKKVYDSYALFAVLFCNVFCQCNGREKRQQLAPIEILTYVRLVDRCG